MIAINIGLYVLQIVRLVDQSNHASHQLLAVRQDLSGWQYKAKVAFIAKLNGVSHFLVQLIKDPIHRRTGSDICKSVIPFSWT